jgi:hypothetical protein
LLLECYVKVCLLYVYGLASLASLKALGDWVVGLTLSHTPFMEFDGVWIFQIIVGKVVSTKVLQYIIFL